MNRWLATPAPILILSLNSAIAAAGFLRTADWRRPALAFLFLACIGFTLARALTTGNASSNWGRVIRGPHPLRYWATVLALLIIWVWIAIGLLVATPR